LSPNETGVARDNERSVDAAAANDAAAADDGGSGGISDRTSGSGAEALTRNQALVAAMTEAVEVFDLGRPMFRGMPQSPNHPQFRMVLERRHGDMSRPDGSSAANELIITGGHVGTHIDALCHVSYRGTLHGGVDASRAQANGGFTELGVETIEPMVRRGVLLDIPAALGVTECPPGYEVTPGDLEKAVHRQGTEPRPGDVILVRTGWGRRFGDGAAYQGLATGVPGPGEAGARWLASRGPVAVGADTIAFEQIRPGHGHALLPAHRVLLVEAGIYILEALELEPAAAVQAHEFVFVCSPLKLVGATGSPVRPLALVARDNRGMPTSAGDPSCT
jgi:kynurenine formamidase